MKSFTNEEYLELCQKLVDNQYDDAIEDYNIADMEWMPAEAPAKQKIKPNTNGIIDLTNIKSAQIMGELFKCTNFKVGAFKIRISTYSGSPDEKEAKIKVSVEVWEERTKTPNGMPCRIDYPMIFYKDSRFKGRQWIEKFGSGNSAYGLPVETVVEIVRWMQAIKKLTAFL